MSNYNFVKELSNEEEYQKIGNDLILFTRKESVLDLDEFPLSLNINPKDFYSFASQSDYFAQCLDVARRTISSRIKRFALEGKIDKQFALQILPLYDDEYKSYLMSQKHGNDASDDSRIINVIIPPIPNTNVVPPLPKTEVIKPLINKDF